MSRQDEHQATKDALGEDALDVAVETSVGDTESVIIAASKPAGRYRIIFKDYASHYQQVLHADAAITAATAPYLPAGVEKYIEKLDGYEVRAISESGVTAVCNATKQRTQKSRQSV